jgi:hypothetical protein
MFRLVRRRSRAALAALVVLAACGGDHAPSGPGGQTSQSPAPAIVAVDVTPALVEPGGSIVVHYHVTSGEPLRKLRFFRSGAMSAVDSIGGRGSTDVTDSIGFPVPTTVSLGGSIVVRVEAEDTLHRVATRTAAGVPVRDTTPPTLSVQFGPNYYPSIDSLRFSTEDTVRLTIGAADNAGVKWVGYRATGAIVAADSTSSGASTTVLRLPLRPSWTGASSFVLFARDASGNERTLIAHAAVYPVVNHLTQRLAFTGVIGQFLSDPKRALVLAARSDTASAIEIFAPSPLGHLAQIRVPAQPGAMELSAGGDSLFVVLPSVASLAVIDLATRTVVSTIPLLASAMTNRVAGDVAAAANGKVFVGLLPNGAPGGGVLEVDLTSGQQRLRTDRTQLPTRLTSSGDHRRIAVNSYPDCEQIYDAVTDAFGTCAQWPNVGGALSSDLHGATFLWGPTLLDAALKPVRSLNAPRFYSPVSQITADGTLAMFSTGYLAAYGFGFVTIRTSDGTIVEQQSLPIVPDVLHVLPDGSAVITQGTVCQQLSQSSYSCRRLGDVFLTMLH